MTPTGQREEPAAPQLPPRPPALNDQSTLQSVMQSSDALKVPTMPTRPQLQSRPTTAVSKTDIHTQLPVEDVPTSPHPRSRAASVGRSISRYGLLPMRAGSDLDDNASIRSFRSTAQGAGRDMESLFGDVKAIQPGDVPSTEGAAPGHDVDVFAHAEERDPLFMHLLDHEFDDLEALDGDGSNEGESNPSESTDILLTASTIESLIVRWRLKLKHYIILSSAGKPIYSRHGDDRLISDSIGVVQTIISSIQDADDSLKSFTAGDARFAILSKGHLHLLAISRMGENDAELRNQLEALYMQILSTLTLPSMERMFLNRPSTDLRRPLEGTETLLSALADDFTRGSPSNLLSALECLRLRKRQREIVNNIMVNCRTPNLLYGLVLAGGRLVSVIRPKKHSLHPGDLHLIFNMVFKAEGLRAGGGENWIPICLPGFNNTGYLYMYVSFLDPSEIKNEAENFGQEQKTRIVDCQDNIVIVLISAKKETFFELRQMRDDLVEQLKSNGSMASVQSAVRSGRPSCTDIIPGTVLRHFLYKSRANVQFVMPSADPHFESAFKWRQLISLYSSLHAAVHLKTSQLKVHLSSNENYMSLAWITPLFEMYCVASPTVGRTALAQGASKLEQWARREEERLFVVGGAVF